MIDTAIERSDGSGKGAGDGGATPKKGFSHRSGTSTGGSLGSLSEGYVANETQDLSKAC
jgi:hypothetical protein